MIFEKAEIIKLEAKSGDQVFIPPFFLHKKVNACLNQYETYEEMVGNWANLTYCYGTLMDGGMYQSSPGPQYKYERAVYLENTTIEILDLLERENRVLTLDLSKEEKAAVNKILKILQPKETDKLFISQIVFDPSMYAGTQIYIGHGVIGVFRDGSYTMAPLDKSTNYKEAFKYLDPKFKNGMPVDKKSYPFIVKECTKSGSRETMQRIKNELLDSDRQIKQYADVIRVLRPQYKTYLEAEKQVKDAKKNLPESLHVILDEGLRKYKIKHDEAKQHAASCHAFAKRKQEVAQTKDFIQTSKKKQGADFKAVNALIKKGIIESISYKAGEGLVWVYSPMVYDTQSTPGKVFLGRVKVVLCEKDEGSKIFRFYMSSYKPGDGAGTWHFYNSTSDGGKNYCLGQFQNMLHNLVAMAKISDLIVVVRDYILSANINSKLHTPNFAVMRMDKPNVIDDSFEVWKAKQAQLETATTQGNA